jgi:hypothetical protein
MIDQYIYQILVASPALTSVVMENIFAVHAHELNLDTYVVIHVIDRVPETTKEEAKLVISRIQVDCYSPDKSICNNIAYLIRTALDRYRGTVSGQAVIDRINYDDARTDFDEDRRLYKVMQDFFVREKIPDKKT